mmetsp:Transcript_12533/g.25824  ORF Transcript_12533/g.25824 Transcript_12533/m.25824 type:complete len:207 (-) Transcript_12533:181-801(-)
MLPLVLPDWYKLRLVQENICCHKDRVIEEPDRHRLSLLLGLLLVLDHLLHPPHRRHAVEEPRQLRVCRNVALDEDLGELRVDAAREVERSNLKRGLLQLLGIVRGRDGVQINHKEEVLVLLLVLHPLPDRAHVVAKMQVSCWLHSTEHSLLDGGFRLVLCCVLVCNTGCSTHSRRHRSWHHRAHNMLSRIDCTQSRHRTPCKRHPS